MRRLLLASTLALLALGASPVEAQSYVELLDDARLFAEPDTYADIVTTLPEEAVGELLQCRTSWCEVRFGGQTGFMKQRNLMATERRPPAPPPPPPAPTPPPTLALATPPPPAQVSLPAPRPEPLYETTPITLPRPAPAPPPAAATPLPEPPPTAAASAPSPAPSPATAASVPPPVATTAPALPSVSPPDPAPQPASLPPTPEPVETPAPASAPTPAPVPQSVDAPSSTADTEAAAPRYSRSASLKNPAAGTLLSAILPGTGHLYAGEPGAGMALLVTAISAPAVGYLLSDRTADLSCVPSPSDPQASCADTTNYAPLFVGVGIAATAWVAGLIDAGAAARRANERERAARVRLDPVARPDYAGLALRVSL